MPLLTKSKSHFRGEVIGQELGDLESNIERKIGTQEMK